MNVSAIYTPPARPDYKAATLDVRFSRDAIVTPSSQPIAEPFASEAAARTAAAAYAVQKGASVLVYNLDSQFRLFEGLAQPTGISNASVPPTRFEIGHTITGGADPVGIRFEDPSVVALIGARHVLENTGGNAKYKF